MSKLKFKAFVLDKGVVVLKEVEGDSLKINGVEFYHYKNDNKLDFIIDIKTGLSLNKVANKTKKSATEEAEKNFQEYESFINSDQYEKAIELYNDANRNSR